VKQATLLINCPDRKGIVFEVTRFISENNGNIIDSQQHSLGLNSRFFMRLLIDVSQFSIPLTELDTSFSPIAAKFDMQFKFGYQAKRMAILVSKYEHCLFDILQKVQRHDIDVELPVIISNHPDLEYVAKIFAIPYRYLPVTVESKFKQEQEILSILESLSIDFIALARYMQILSSDFVARYPSRIINVHHSFLPSFKGANPYHQAYDKGVKVIGATAHYVTEELDMGPIISQGVSSVGYRDTVEDYISKGRDIEEQVFSRAIKAHAQDKIINYDGKTVVFD
jgi:formyltetrahydrofolate deformylase